MCERIFVKLLPGLKLTHEEVDGVYQGLPIEIKGCLESIPRSDTGKRRAGQLHFKGWQHDFLLENGGNYAIGVYHGRRFIKHAVIPAVRICPEHFEGEKTFSWPAVLKGVA